MVSLRRKRLNVTLKDIATAENTSDNTMTIIKGERNDHVENIRIENGSPVKEEIVEDNIQEIVTAKKQKVEVELDTPMNTTVKKEDEPTEQKQQENVKIDPDNPSEVHAYLMQLYTGKKLDPRPIQTPDNEDIPMKEWMEKCYPHIFEVFPQNPCVGDGLAGGRTHNLLVFYYSLFLCEMKSIFMMADSEVTPNYVNSLLEVIVDLEKQGFDCRFMRSEMLVAADKIQRRHDLIVAEKLQIEARISYLENTFGVATTDEKPCETSKKMEWKSLTGKMQESNFEKLVTFDMPPSRIVDIYIATNIISDEAKILASKEEELRRLAQVVRTIQEGNAPSSDACSGTNYH